jgi:hypothetical protein
MAFYVPGVATGMMTWLLIKAVSNWTLLYPLTKPEDENENKRRAKLRTLTYSTLLGSLMSLLFAVIGGLICKG